MSESQQEQLNRIEARLRPSPERVATAKAWLAENKLAKGLPVSPEGASTEFAAAQGVEGSREDDQDPANQEAFVAWWEWAVAMREAIHDFHLRGFLTPTAQFSRKEPPGIEGFLDLSCPQIPIGEPGERNRATPFPAPVLYKGYAPSITEHAEQEHRLELYDSDLYANAADLSAFDDRARRCVEEALVCYRADLFLAAGNMLGAASEAVWYEIANAMLDKGLVGSGLKSELGKDAPGIAAVQRQVVVDLQALSNFRSKFGMPVGVLKSLAQGAEYWRDVRNYGMHPRGTFGPDSFTQAAIAVQLQGATEYFKKLATILRGL